ncbi:monovalent cation/H+ antiporter complex subunit F [Cellulosimicrobium arenosum]|uniref:MrpF/PhaF family protein n=1 Tax=Cellulosimicrobium arenosum TaxID=2708133 RepID=A0A927J158_9MICO|nr:MrpF/PhaF family protein [Cellulosimicrobium arenosum]MBD8079890.1 MrpF/PhaF family protein [Cellulosimicrobium arenosum]
MTDTWFLVVVVVCGVLLAAAAVLAVARVERGPSTLDRTIALDVFTTTLVGAIALEAAFSRRTDTIPLLVVLSLVGFVSSVTVARFASVEPEGEGRVRTAEEIAAEEAARLTEDDEERAAVDPEHHGGGPDGEVR